MALKAIRRSTGNNAFDWMVTSAQIASNVSSMLQFPPTMAATTDIKTNQQGWVQLVQRAAHLLMDLGRHMEGKWEDAPRSLLENIRELEATLLSIRDFMLKAAQTEWISRLVAKTSIQEPLMRFDRFDQQLKDATMSFQVLPRGTPQESPTGNFTSPTQSSEALASLGDGTTLECSASSFELVQKSCDSTESLLSSFTLVEPDSMVWNLDITDPTSSSARQIVEPLAGLKERRRHIRRSKNDHQEIRRHERPCVEAMGERHKDVEESSPRKPAQILGYSDGMAQTPFILLASVQCRDLASTMRSALTTRSLANCASLILKTYRDIARLRTQQQQPYPCPRAMLRTSSITRPIVSTAITTLYRIAAPREGWVTARSYCLEESLSHRALHYLKELMNAEELPYKRDHVRLRHLSTLKYKQLKSLLQCLLPRQREGLGLPPNSKTFSMMQTKTTRSLSVLYGPTASKNRGTTKRGMPELLSGLCSGDYGYIPEGSTDFANFFLIACGASLASTHGIQRKAVVDMFIHEWQRETLQAGRTRRHNKPSTDAPCGLALNARLFARRARRARG
ncbi:hypothetical protein BGY98DRAFT_1099198 [Russula aff. rugulosa BPL654]|nr:hypothetical protein BGY98DRAFT_1099198 [Russula aff. rugulosa BPL654]